MNQYALSALSPKTATGQPTFSQLPSSKVGTTHYSPHFTAEETDDVQRGDMMARLGKEQGQSTNPEFLLWFPTLLIITMPRRVCLLYRG